jgi:tetratricopeptide (TPR) repeat protein
LFSKFGDEIATPVGARLGRLALVIAFAQCTARSYYDRGFARQDKGDLDGAIIDYTRAIHADPKFTLAYFSRGVAKQNKRDLDGALADYNMAIELDPKLASAFRNRAAIEFDKGEVDGAFRDLERALE